MSGTVDKLVDTALELAERRPWAQMSLREILDASALSLCMVYPAIQNKSDILAAIFARIDKVMLAEVSFTDEMVQERLFELFMARFDFLQSHRYAMLSLFKYFKTNPCDCFERFMGLERAMGITLSAAGLGSEGILGRIRKKVLTAVYLYCLNTWQRDESMDMALTMRTVDETLKRLDQWVNYLPETIKD